MPLLVRRALLLLIVLVSLLAIDITSASAVNGLIYYTTSNGVTSHVWTMNPDGSEQHQVTTDGANNQSTPSVSPNGQTVAYSSAIGSNQQIFTQPIIGGAGTDFSNVTGSAVAVQPSYCGDGSLTWLEDTAGNELWDVFRNGVDVTNTQRPESGEHQQAEYTEHDVQCSLANEISFVRYTDVSAPLPAPSPSGTVTFELWTLSPGETGLGVQRTSFKGAGSQQISNVKASSWSPDGNQIAFIATTTADAGEQLFTMKSDGSGITRVGDVAGANPAGLAWSPDFTKVAYVRSDHQVEIVNLADNTGVAIAVTAYGGLDWVSGPGAVVGVPIGSPGPTPAPPSPPPALVASVGRTPARTTLTSLLVGGLSNEVSCNVACTAIGKLYVTAAVARKLGLLAPKSKSKALVPIGSATVKRTAAGSFRLTIRLTGKARSKLRRLTSIIVTQAVTVTSGSGTSITKRTLKLTAKRKAPHR